MANWYDDPKQTVHVVTYENNKTFEKEATAALQRGWEIQNSAGIGGHVNVGRTATGAVLTGGVSLLFGGSRGKDKITVTYLRTDEWKAQNLGGAQFADLMQQVGKASSDLPSLEAKFAAASKAVRDAPNPHSPARSPEIGVDASARPNGSRARCSWIHRRPAESGQRLGPGPPTKIGD